MSTKTTKTVYSEEVDLWDLDGKSAEDFIKEISELVASLQRRGAKSIKLDIASGAIQFSGIVDLSEQDIKILKEQDKQKSLARIKAAEELIAKETAKVRSY